MLWQLTIEIRWCNVNGLNRRKAAVIGHQPHLVYHKVVYEVIKDPDTNIGSKISELAASTRLCHKARKPDDKTELQDDVNKCFNWTKKWKVNINYLQVRSKAH